MTTPRSITDSRADFEAATREAVESGWQARVNWWEVETLAAMKDALLAFRDEDGNLVFDP